MRAVLPHVTDPVRAMVLVQWFTGMRPGEAVQMRGCDIDMSGKVWFYRPAQHKIAHHGRQRVVPIGPEAQNVRTSGDSRHAVWVNVAAVSALVLVAAFLLAHLFHTLR